VALKVLSLAAATVLFVLSQDRLNMDLDTESFQLILALAKTEQNPDILDENPELSKHKQRIIDLVAEMQNRGHAKHIKIEKITVIQNYKFSLYYEIRVDPAWRTGQNFLDLFRF